MNPSHCCEYGLPQAIWEAPPKQEHWQIIVEELVHLEEFVPRLTVSIYDRKSEAHGMAREVLDHWLFKNPGKLARVRVDSDF